MVKWLPYHNDHSHIAVMPCHHCHITITTAPSLYRHIAKSPSPCHNPLLPYSMFPYHHYHIAVSLYCLITIDRPHHNTLLPYHHRHIAIWPSHIAISPSPYCHVTFIIWAYHHHCIAYCHTTITIAIPQSQCRHITYFHVTILPYHQILPSRYRYVIT